MDLDFTLTKYSELCEGLQEHYKICTLFEYLTQCNSSDSFQNSNQKMAILRHDVDRKIKNALRMAELEHDLGIRSSYYFRYPYTFNPNIIRQIHNLGHEIGYHYETLSKAKGDSEKAIKLFEQELDAFRQLCKVKTICMHGSPLSPYDNRDLWQKYDYDFHDFGIEGEAYLSLENVQYFSDTGRNWNGINSMRDFLPGANEAVATDTTDDLIQYIKTGDEKCLYLTVHPERWADNEGTWVVAYMTDLAFNTGKKVITVMR